MGTPEFAVASLDILIKNKYNIVAVITAPDRPAGRGQQLQQSEVKKYAIEKGLNILQPEKLKDEVFLTQLRGLNADLQIVVAFRMLPEVVWNMPKKGTVNLHGSLLPQYRGAAPINWAIINGEKETGVSTFFLQHEIDTGKIIYQEKTSIKENDNAEIIHGKLMKIGASLILKTVQAIEIDNYPQVDQSELVTKDQEIKPASKIFKDDCFINWNKSLTEIFNFVRGLSPYPAAYTIICGTDNRTHHLKIFKCQKEITQHKEAVGSIHTDSKNYLKIGVVGGYISILDLQLSGKKRMEIMEFLRGFPINDNWRVLFNNKLE